MIHILIVEDDENYRFEISQELESRFEKRAVFYYASNLEDALNVLSNETIHLLIIDIIFPLTKEEEANEQVDYQAGVKLLEQVTNDGFVGNIVVLSSQNKTFAVDLLIRYRNVRDYVFKDSTWKEIQYKIEKQLEDITEKRKLKAQLQKSNPLIGNCEHIQKVKKMAEKVKGLDTTVLITGESGVGKEVVAGYFHKISDRREDPFVVVNCAAVPESLFESLLFGHKKGSFTGADTDELGAFRSADGGTIFLDEIGELPLQMQSKLLRALQEKKITPVGNVKPESVDVRVIVATNRNLEDLVENKEFREDLFYRLNVLRLELPPLRQRAEDILELSEYFLGLIHHRTGMERALSQRVKELFVKYGWPGNIRELKNTLERMVIMSDGDTIEYEDAIEILPSTSEDDYRVQFPISETNYKDVKNELMDAFHKKFFSYHLKINNYQIGKTAESVGYNRNDLSNTIKKLGIETKK